MIAKRLASALLVAGATLVGAGLWGVLGWPAAVIWWGGCGMAAGLAEVFDVG